MGATSWSYFVPYQQDIAAALEELREEVFEDGDYEFVEYEPEDMEELETEDPELYHLVQQGEPTTIEDLLTWSAESGTHSILDIMNGVSERPAFGTVSPLADSQLRALFGTTKPTIDQVEEQEDEIVDLRDRWQGTYIICYEDGEPAEIFFGGYSGD